MSLAKSIARDRRSILVIEDDPGQAELIRRNLQRGTGRVDSDLAETMAAGLTQLEIRQYDVILADLTLPDSRGLESVKCLRAACGTTPIVVLTSLCDELLEGEVLEAGAQDYLNKDGATPVALERAIRHAMSRHSLLTKNERLLASLKESRRLLSTQQKLLRKKNRQLRQLCDTAETFVDNVSHEFRTPLTVIKDYVSLVRDEHFGQVNDEQRGMLNVALVRVDDLDTMVNDMLDSSKLTSGTLSAWRSPCKLEEILNLVLPALRRKAEVKQIKFDVQIAEQLPDVFCDEEKVRRVLINLVANAMKFCGNPGTVRIDAQLDDAASAVVIRVTDNGPGIAAVDLQSIFGRFRQLLGKEHYGTKGFGLGLGIAKELVELNLGRLNVESRMSHGSTFSFTIPVDNPQCIFSRYLDSLSDCTDGSAVTLVDVSIDGTATSSEADCLDTVLNSVLRSHDLILRVDGHRWLIAAHVSTVEVSLLLVRLEDELVKIDRNRPAGPLPKAEFTVQGTWQAADQAAEVWQCAGQLLGVQDEALRTGSSHHNASLYSTWKA